MNPERAYYFLRRAQELRDRLANTKNADERRRLRHAIEVSEHLALCEDAHCLDGMREQKKLCEYVAGLF